MKKRQFEIGIDHPMMIGAKAAFDTCMRGAVTKAIGTGSDEGSVTLKISFEILMATDQESGEVRRMPVFKYKAGYSVPMKGSIDATICESSKLIHDDEVGFMLVNDQVSIEELLDGEDE